MRRRREPPSPVEEFIAEVLRSAALSPERSDALRADLHAHFEDGLAEGHTALESIRRFGDPESAGIRLAEVQGSAARRRSPQSKGRSPSDLEQVVKTSWRGVLRAAWSELASAPSALVRTPRFAALVVLTLALGVGANTAVFSVLDAALLRPLPYPEPERLVSVIETWEGEPMFEFVRAPAVRAMRSWGEVFEGVATMYTYRETGADLTGRDRAERLSVSPVSAGFFALLGGEPILGRVFEEDESYGPGEHGGRSAAPRSAVLSHELWARRFGADPDVVGRLIELDGRSVQVVGVMEPGFRQPMGVAADVWVPQDLRAGGSNHWGNFYLTVIGRLQDGVSEDQARERMAAHVAAIREAEPDSGEWGVLLEPLQSKLVGETRRTLLWVLSAAVLLVLLSACVNVANLVFARGLRREQELAMRGVLGAGRRRLMLQLLSENLWLAVLGALVGLGLGWFGLRTLLLLGPEALPRHAAPGLSPSVFLFALAAVGATLLLFGLAPSLLLSRVAPSQALRAGGRSGTETRGLRRTRTGLVVAQASVAMVLLIGAGLLLRSFERVQRAELGVLTENALTFEVNLPGTRYPEGAGRQAFHERLHERIATLPGVSSVGAISWLPLNGRYHIWGGTARVDDPAADEPEVLARSDGADVRVANGDFLDALGIRLLSGQAPGEVTVAPDGEELVWINRSVATQLFDDGTDPVGEVIWAANALRRIVGVVEDAAVDGRGSKFPAVYVHHTQYADNRNWPLSQVVRVQGDPLSLVPLIRAEMEQIDADLVLHQPRSLESLLATSRVQDRFALLLMGLFALLATMLVSIGMYGVLAGHVAQYRRDFGIRMALGASRGHVLRRVLAQALRMAAVGVAVGGTLSWAGSRWVSSLLFEVEPGDPLTIASALGVVFLLCLMAGFLPAHRATRVDPARSLTE